MPVGEVLLIPYIRFFGPSPLNGIGLSLKGLGERPLPLLPYLYLSGDIPCCANPFRYRCHA
jgi:hypothetical protein